MSSNPQPTSVAAGDILFSFEDHILLKNGRVPARILAAKCSYLDQYIPEVLQDPDAFAMIQSLRDRLQALSNRVQSRRVYFDVPYAKELVKELRSLSLFAEGVIVPIFTAIAPN